MDSGEYPRRVYLDVCVLCRPFDDQNQMRVRLETDAVTLIISHVRRGDLWMPVSPVHQTEIAAISEKDEREYLQALLLQVGGTPSFDLERARTRAEHLTGMGLGLADAAHLAFAEQSKADFVTCDLRLLAQIRHIQTDIWCGSPIAYVEMEELS